MAAAKRDDGMRRADEHADDEWKDRASALLDAYLRQHPEFFVDDFWRESALDAPREARALGPIIQRAAREGRIVKTGNYRPSVRSNLTPKPVWRSTVYEGGTPP